MVSSLAMSRAESAEAAPPLRCPRCAAPIYGEDAEEGEAATCRYCAQSLLASADGRAALKDGLLVAVTGLGTLALALSAAAHG